MTKILRQPQINRLMPVCEDRASLRPTAEGGLRLELTGIGDNWVVELTRADCEAIAEAIGLDIPGRRRIRMREVNHGTEAATFG